MDEISPEDLAVRYLWCIEEPASSPEDEDIYSSPVFVWERWIVDDPERAWSVFLELLRRRDDDEALEQFAYRLEVLLAHHWEAFHDRARRLVASRPNFERVVPPAALEREYYETPEPGLAEFVPAYLTADDAFDVALELEKRVRADAEGGLELTLEAMRRGSAAGLEILDMAGPLTELLKHHGPAVIDRVAAAAAGSALVRRCLWRIRQMYRREPAWYPPIAAPMDRAIGATTEYTVEPATPPAPRPLRPDQERLVSPWVTLRQNYWAFRQLSQWGREEPEKAWEAIVALVAQAPTEGVLDFIGAGPLEDLLDENGERFIERVEARAASDPKFRRSLANVWRGGMSDAIWQRVRTAVGEQADD